MADESDNRAQVVDIEEEKDEKVSAKEDSTVRKGIASIAQVNLLCTQIQMQLASDLGFANKTLLSLSKLSFC